MTDKFQGLIEIPKWKGSQRRVGLTGGIASGKTSVGDFLKEVKGLPVIDADKLSRDALAPQTIASKEIIKRYKNKITTEDNDVIDRKVLAEIIFSNPEERLWIERLLHPIIHKKLIKEIKKQKNSPVLILVIPLLFEARLTSLCNEVWVVNCTEKQQYERLCKRDNITYDDAKKRIQSQWPLDKKTQLADEVIENSGNFKTWVKKIEEIL